MHSVPVPSAGVLDNSDICQSYLLLCHIDYAGYLAVCCQPKLFEELIGRLLNGLAQGKESSMNFSVNNTKTFIQAIGAIR